MNADGRGGFGDNPENINKSGRPRDTITPLVKAIGNENDGEKARQLAETLWQKAIDGDIQAAKLVWTKLDGMPGQSIHVEDERDDSWRDMMRELWLGNREQVPKEDSDPLPDGEAETADTGRRSTFGEDMAE